MFQISCIKETNGNAAGGTYCARRRRSERHVGPGTSGWMVRLRRMPRFFFHVYNDIVAEDEEGMDLSDVAAARNEAIKGARELIAQEIIDKGSLHLSHRVDIADEHGRIVMTIPFRELVDIREDE